MPFRGFVNRKKEKGWPPARLGDPTCTTIGTCAHANIVRQWAELAYWFPFRTHAVGAGALMGVPVTNIDLTLYAPPPQGNVFQQLGNTPAHSYLEDSKYSLEFTAWQQIASSLQ